MNSDRYDPQVEARPPRPVGSCGPDDGPPASVADALASLIQSGAASLPRPGGGQTLARWQALARVAAQDLSLVKLFEGHCDAMAILAEADAMPVAGARYGMWAAEPPGARVVFREAAGSAIALHGTKGWCSGAAAVDRALLTVWDEAGQGPWLADLDLRGPGVTIDERAWQAVGMADTASATVHFASTPARLVGPCGFYLERPGFWQGGIGVAACWHGAACAVAEHLLSQARSAAEPGWHRLLALGDIDRVLSANAALLREAAGWVDAHPSGDARVWALRTRAACDETAQQVLRWVSRASGAGPLCMDPWMARMAADLPVFIRQCHADRDLVNLGAQRLKEAGFSWTL